MYNHVVGELVLTGVLRELSSIPLIRRYLTPHVRNILAVINQRNPSFTIFPMLSFVLLAVYGVQRTYLLSTFILLLLSTVVVAFSYYLIAVSIEQTKRNQQQLAVTARTDALTGLYNRGDMEQRIQEEYGLYQTTGSEFALIIADIDLFKKINDMYGHACGDLLLTSVSEDVRDSVRKCDAVARWGGDEFFLLLPATNATNVAELAERIRNTVEKSRYAYENETLSVTLTLGVAVIRSGDIVASIIKKADQVMYEGKRTGRNCVISFDSITNTDTSERY